MKLSGMKIDPALSEQGDWVENFPDLRASASRPAVPTTVSEG
jgi:hypothetical protein